MSKQVVILCSGFGLGFYIPGLLVSEKLRSMGIPTEVEVFEGLLPEEKLQMVEKNRQAYHQSFRVALASQKVPGDTRASLDPAALESLMATWQRRNCRHFICLSGHWVHVLDIYRERYEVAMQADLLYVDADLSPSWRWLRKLKPEYASGYREVRLYDPAPSHSIDANMGVPLPYTARERRLVVHGGGWGIGTFQQRILDIEAKDYGLDVVCYAKSEAVAGFPNRRYFMDDPSWRTWHRNGHGEHTFPPFGEISADSQPFCFAQPSGCHGLHRVIRSASAIVSKPGAGTLIDSFSSATPLIMLEPFGPHEERNADVWESSGFGIAFAAWSAAGYRRSILESLHDNLLKRRGTVRDYAQSYSKTLYESAT